MIIYKSSFQGYYENFTLQREQFDPQSFPRVEGDVLQFKLVEGTRGDKKL